MENIGSFSLQIVMNSPENVFVIVLYTSWHFIIERKKESPYNLHNITQYNYHAISWCIEQEQSATDVSKKYIYL